jgi:hypothetical protein
MCELQTYLLEGVLEGVPDADLLHHVSRRRLKLVRPFFRRSCNDGRCGEPRLLPTSADRLLGSRSTTCSSAVPLTTADCLRRRPPSDQGGW